jgi:hypothetical protein
MDLMVYIKVRGDGWTWFRRIGEMGCFRATLDGDWSRQV